LRAFTFFNAEGAGFSKAKRFFENSAVVFDLVTLQL